MNEKISLDEYKKKVMECLIKCWHNTEERASSLIELYEADFPLFYEEKWEPSLAATAIKSGY